MSLRVWLPLNGDLRNQGVSGITITPGTGAAVQTDGKIGKCYRPATITLTNLDDFSFNNSSFCFWAKTNATSTWQLIIGIDNSNLSQIHGIYVADTTRYKLEYNPSLNIYGAEIAQWHHYAFIIQSGKSQAYCDGVLKASSEEAVTNDIIGRLRLGVGTAISLNDVRIYDHALSATEVREIAQGLVLHYKLDRGGSSSNLIINGDGKSGTANWATPANTSTEVPSTEYGRSFFNNTIKEFIPINSSHEYKIEEWIKANSGATGTTYPSIYPYDIDKKFIQYFHIAFNGSTLTTLTHALNPGDTKIYVASLANWNANSGHWYNYAALFSYQDSTGYVYPDLTYTQNTPAFASSTAAKTNLDKTNNIITLNSAYTGPALPIGTKVCASTAGSSYWYPYGGINMASIYEWTHKTYTFIPKNDGRLRYAHFIKYFTYAQNNVLHAGIKLTDLSESNDIEDSSGYNHNGTIIGDLILGEKQGRYSNSLRWNSSAPTVSSEDGICYIQTPFTLTTPLQMSITWWAKPESGYGGSTNHAAFCTSSNASRPTDYNTTAFHHRDAGFDIYPSDASDVKRLSFTYTANAWHHYAITYDGSTAKAYQDGVLKTSVAVGTNKTLATFSQLYIGFSQAGGAKRKTLGSYSDFRIYVTALSADDILQLYHTSAKIDNKQNLHTFELVEPATRISINKQGQILCNELEETTTTKFYKTDQIIETNNLIEL